MGIHKIIFAGPVGAGKTTAIGAVSDIDPVVTDVRASDETAQLKESTTVAMDYGALDLDSGERVHLYGTPGQERFDFMWEILSEGALGLVLLISNSRPEPLADLEFFLRAFDPLIRSTRLAVGVTSMDLVREPPLADHRRVLLDAGLRHPVFEVDARRRQDVSMLIQALLLADDPRLGTGPRS
ncbi:MAG TPA: ATP/GTP-binding protein [Kineosporiaceae bacterium]|nr:ATP/GTP-binding protein [Kineosporiaceae bacterium]